MVMPMPIEALSQQVQSALRHLHDHVCLQNSALAHLLFPGTHQGGPIRGQRLRRLILEAMEQLSPPPGAGSGARNWRGSYILTSHYLDGRTAQEIAAELAISERQFYREQQQAVSDLASMLWERSLCARDDDTGGSSDVPRTTTSAPNTLRGEAERLVAYQENVDLADLYQGVLEAVSSLAEARDVVVSCRFDRDLPTVLANRTVVRQILIHVLGRCITHPQARQVHVMFRREGECAAVDVATVGLDGARVPVTELGDVYRIHPLLEVIGGEHGGISTRSVEDCVQFLIPMAGQRVILLIEDNPGVVQLLRRYLGYHGYLVISMATSAECVRLLGEQRPAAIVLDIMLPRQDGWEILRELRAHPAGRDIPILVCSVLDEAPIAQSLGASAYLRKPFSQSEILALLSTLVPGR